MPAPGPRAASSSSGGNVSAGGWRTTAIRRPSRASGRSCSARGRARVLRRRRKGSAPGRSRGRPVGSADSRVALLHRSPRMASSLELTLLYLVAAVGGVVLCRLARLPPILGYLAVGILIGPHAMAVSGDSAGISHLAEFGIV